jgi:hypothetical protein
LAAEVEEPAVLDHLFTLENLEDLVLEDLRIRQLLVQAGQELLDKALLEVMVSDLEVLEMQLAEELEA